MGRTKLNIKKNSPDSFVEAASEKEEKEKVFMVKIPYSLWKEAKIQALKEDKTLHQFILEALQAKVDSYSR